MVDNVDLGTFVGDIKDTIQHLENEEELEKQIIKEQKDAENKLADALQKLQNEEAVFRAIIYFRKVDLTAPSAQVHQQVEKIINKNARIGSANQLATEVEKVESILQEIEQAQEEIRDAYQKTQQDVQDEQEEVEEIGEVHEMISEISKGASKYQQWANGRQ